MARKPKTQPSPEVAAAVPAPEPAAPDQAIAPARRGRKPKTAALLSASPVAADVGSPVQDGAGSDIRKAAPIKAPGRRGPGRKPKPAAGAQAAPSIQDAATGLRDQAVRKAEAEASPGLTGDDTPMAAAASQAETAAGSASVQPGRGPAGLADEAARSVPEAEASVSAKPAARWDQATDVVRFDWPAIERVAARGGPNQGMAKLLVAARAGGAGSRWPF